MIAGSVFAQLLAQVFRVASPRFSHNPL